MNGVTSAVVRGRVYGAVCLRYTVRGTPAARFTLIQVSREYNRTRGTWHDGEPVPFICTVTGPLARHVAECLTDAVHVIATGNLALRNSTLYLDSAQVGIDLAHHVTYTDDTLPAVLAGRTFVPAPPSRTTAALIPPPAHCAEPAQSGSAARSAGPPAAAPAREWWRSAPRTP
ncbi:single-stranded DNA-binding protein [Streptomyces sp. NPDC002755]|uniref:single-stranded DNA-binding protein n=1 Tax=Streptomyces sp. NPDC002884 TaxID=3154544 RepID=UPI00332F8D65